MAKHRAPDDEDDVQPAPAKLARWHPFRERYLPHWAMAIMTGIWMFFNLKLGTAGVPPTLNQVFGGISGIWFGYLIRERTTTPPPKGE